MRRSEREKKEAEIWRDYKEARESKSKKKKTVEKGRFGTSDLQRRIKLKFDAYKVGLMDRKL